MRRGTTPTHTFTLPFHTESVKNAMIVYVQGDREILRKNVSQCRMDGNTLSVTLTQEETLKFRCDKRAQIQVRVLTHLGEALASNILNLSVEKCLIDEVL